MITKHYLFDLDGTLIDSMGYWARAMLDLLDARHVPYDDDIIEVITPFGLRDTALYFISMGMEGTVEEILAAMDDFLTPYYLNVIPLKAHVKHCLERMKEKGYHLHVLTASPQRWLRPCLAREGVLHLFENAWSSEDFGITKTNPDIYRQAAARMGAELSDVTFLDDNINADKAALAAGVRVLGVFDATSADSEKDMRAICHGYIRDFSELEREID